MTLKERFATIAAFIGVATAAATTTNSLLKLQYIQKSDVGTTVVSQAVYNAEQASVKQQLEDVKSEQKETNKILRQAFRIPNDK